MPTSASDCAILLPAAIAYALLHLVEIDPQRFHLPQQHHVVALALVRVAPDSAVRKYFEECSDRALDRLQVGLEQLDVHRDDAAGVEMLLHHLEEFLGVQVGRALHPRIQRIDGDSVEAFLGRHQVVAAVVDPHLDLGIAQDIEIRLAKVGGSGLRNQRLDFHDGLAFYSWIDGHRACRNSRAAANHQDRARVCRRQSGEVPQHSLEPHVSRHVRSLDLAGDVKGQDAVRKAGDGH